MLQCQITNYDSGLPALADKIEEAVAGAGYIKQEYETVTSRKYVAYIPYYG